MKLHAVYRTTGSENRKRRPEMYSKGVALSSFLASLESVRDVGDLVFIIDGPIPDAQLALFRSQGEVIQLAGVGNSSSYRRALMLLHERTDWSDDDLVYFGEDDYLYRPDALSRLFEAAGAIDGASFFTVYDHPDYYEHRSQLRFARHHGEDHWQVGDVSWRAVRSTTMTFAARIERMRRASFLHVLGSRGPYPRDFDIWSASQTYLHRYRLVRSLMHAPDTTPVAGPRTRPRAGLHALVSAPRGALVAPRAPLATHLEVDCLAPGADWRELAASCGPAADAHPAPASLDRHRGHAPYITTLGD